MYIIHVQAWGYYGGQNEKYSDMFNVVPKKYAKRFEDKKRAERVKDSLEDGKWEVMIEEVEG